MGLHKGWTRALWRGGRRALVATALLLVGIGLAACGARPATLMGHVARGLSDDDLHAMAAYFESQSPAPGSAAALNPLRPGAPR